MIKIIKEVNKEDLREWLYDIDVNDKNLYEELNSKNAIGIFQLQGKTASKLSDEIQPDNFEDMNVVNALARPGPIDVAAPYFIKRKNGEKSPYPDKVNDLLKETHNTIIYQEQIMAIFHKIGGFTLEGANEIRNLMKKLGKADKAEEDLKKWDKAIKKFKKGCIANGISEYQAEKVKNDILAFSSYSFNKSHSTAYTYIAAMTLYLSVYFRKYFYSSVLIYEADKDKYLLERMQTVKNKGFEILPPDINKSREHLFAVEDKKILFGLSDLKYISEDTAKIIIDNRPYKSVLKFIFKTRCRKVTSKVITVLILSGVFDNICDNRKKMLFIFERFWKEKKSIRIEEKLELIWKKCEEDAERILGLDTKPSDLRIYEKDIFGFNFFTSLFEDHKIEAFHKMAKQRLIYLDFYSVKEYSLKIPVCINSFRSFIDRSENEMAFVDMEDIKGQKQSVPIFASYWKFIKEKVVPGSIYLLNIYRDSNDKLLFGQKQWITNEFKISRMIKKI